MHMADALLSPITGSVMIAVSAATIGYSAKKITGEKLDEKKIPMMGVMGAFVFAAQMINFTIPGTGSSGHIGGGILLAALLGPSAALVTLSSVLLIQCLFFADGGLLAYGCNVFNLGVCACLIAYQLLYEPIIKRGINQKSIIIASILSTVLGLQIGALCVILETLASGITELPFGVFTLLMQPIHLVIGLVEGIVTAAVLCFVQRMRPELLGSAVENAKIAQGVSMKKLLAVFIAVTVLIGGGLSLLASSLPDGLEWSIEKAAGTAIGVREGAVYEAMGNIVENTALMPDYAFTGDEEGTAFSTATAGIVGSVITMILAGGTGFFIHAARKKATTERIDV